MSYEGLTTHNNKPLPTWCEMTQVDRHKLLGELIDAMIYSGNAVLELEMMVEKFRTAGYVKSIILPEIATNEDN